MPRRPRLGLPYQPYRTVALSRTFNLRKKLRPGNPTTGSPHQVMRQLVSGFIALALCLIGMVVCGVTCNNSTGAFPATQLWYCVNGGTNQSHLIAALGNLGANGKLQLTTSKGQFYVFYDYQDYNSFCQTGNYIVCSNTVTQNTLGQTVFEDPPLNSYSVIFENQVFGAVVTPNQQLNNTTQHEAGHQLDPIYGLVLGSSSVGASSAFKTELNTYDWRNFLARTPQCDPSGHGTTGVFNLQRGSGGTFICANNGDGPGLGSGYSGNNQTVLQVYAWPYYYSQQQTPGAFAELWAEEVAVLSSAGQVNINGVGDPDVYMQSGNGFQCTEFLVSSLLTTGKAPISQANYPHECQ